MNIYCVLCFWQSKHVDLLQLMINAETTSLDESVSTDLTMTDDKETSSDDVNTDQILSANKTGIAGSQTKRALTVKVRTEKM